MTDEDKLALGFIALTVIGVLVLLTTSLIFLGSLLLGTGAVGWYVLDRRHKVTKSDIQRLEDYANRGEEEK